MRRHSITAFLLFLIIGSVVVDYFGDRVFVPETERREEALECGGADCEALGPERMEPLVLSPSEACVNAGYLCADLERGESFRVIRFQDDLERIRVRVPLPEHEPPARARELQNAVVRGISTWDGRPFEIVVDTRRRSVLPSDIEIEWVRQLSNNRLGVTRTTVGARGRELYYRVDGLALATRSPRELGRTLDPEQVMLTAAHEMGHVLGLPHSDESRDVMYEFNTARALTNRDYRTLGALYELPRGALIRREAARDGR